ncbi:hypothetical protein [Chamaesiphon sp. VAR_48_metabat_135_sub]|uniref:hypothetical protein n=1 Tax=Chamaesiphon sp. VAR_48_metabat_135_sub TaxID=2964699 RepID=UPI00286C250B|nr:hypothetical protein [Chamaesiphon sp. VAR_48_metabat_135_sub]
MLNISKYQRAIVGCSAIASTSFCGFVQSATATEQFRPQNTRIDRGTTLIAQVKSGGGLSIGSGGNRSNATGINVGNGTGIPIGSGGNKSNGSGINVGNGTGLNIGSGGNRSNASGINVGNAPGQNIGSGGNRSNATGANGGNSRLGTSSRGFSSGTIARAGNIGARINLAEGNYQRAAAALAQAEAAQPNASNTSPVRYALAKSAPEDCGCLNADLVGTKAPDRPELIAARAAEAEAAAELAAAKAEGREFLESVKNNSPAETTVVFSPLW